MASLGFSIEEHVRIVGRASEETMLERPGLRVTLFRRPARQAPASVPAK
jgi:hypothetical protein